MDSLINQYVTVGKNSSIWHFCNLYGTKENPVKIGHHTQIGSYCEIKPGTHIGNFCRIQTRVFIPEFTTIGNYVFIGPAVIIANDKYPTAQKTLSHTYTISPVIIQAHSSIGAGSIIGPGVTIGRHAIVGMGAVVVKNVPTGAIVAGNPAKVISHVSNPKYQKLFS